MVFRLITSPTLVFWGDRIHCYQPVKGVNEFEVNIPFSCCRTSCNFLITSNDSFDSVSFIN